MSSLGFRASTFVQILSCFCAINNTTVEVAFKEAIEDVKAIDFKIEGLTVENAVVKQTGGDKVVVLTTSKQEGDKVYTVTVDGNKAGTFKGVSAVIPTKINVTTASVQGVIGKEVTVSAQVEVAEGASKAGIPVTFNITSDNSNLNSKIEVEAVTNADGVASYSYTRYYSHNDHVAAYATSKSSVVSNGKVYWASAIQLAVSELTTGNDLANETKKSYKVAGAANTTYYVAIKENLNVAPDKITDVKVQNHTNILNQNFLTPYELTTGATQFASVTTNANGEGSFTVYGTNLSATPIVYLPSSVNTSATNNSYSKLALQAQAPTVKFSQMDRLAIAVAGEGTADSAEYFGTVAPVAHNANSAGGRTYTVTVTDKEGKLAPAGTVAHVKFDDMAGDVYFTTGTANFVKVNANDIKTVTVGKEGKAQFRVAGKGATSYVKPTVFLNTAGTVSPVALDKTDVQTVAEVTYFKSPIVTNAVLKVTDLNGRVITSLPSNEDAYFTYQSVDQNGFAYRAGAYTTTPGSTTTIYVQHTDPLTGVVTFVPQQVTTNPITSNNYVLAFDVTSTFGNAVVKDANGVVLPVVQNVGSTKTYNVTSDANGQAVVRVSSQSADTVSVNVTGASNILPTATASVNFTNSNTLPAVYTGNATIDKTRELITFAKATTGNYDAVSYATANFTQNGVNIGKAAFEALTSADKAAGFYSEVTANVNASGVYTFDYRVRTATALPTPVLPGKTGVISWTNSTFNALATQKINVTDLDFANNGTSLETFVVSVKDTAGTSVPVTLTEVADTGVFAGDVSIAQLGMFADGLITVTYNDAKTAANVPGVATATATLNTLTGALTFSTAPTAAYVPASVTRAAVKSSPVSATVTAHSVDFTIDGSVKTANILALSGTVAQNAAAVAAKITLDTGLTTKVNASNEVIVSAPTDTAVITAGFVTDVTAGFNSVTTTGPVTNAATPAKWAFSVTTSPAVGEKVKVIFNGVTKTLTALTAGPATVGTSFVTDVTQGTAATNIAGALAAQFPGYTVSAAGSIITITQDSAAPTTATETLSVSVTK